MVCKYVVLLVVNWRELWVTLEMGRAGRMGYCFVVIKSQSWHTCFLDCKARLDILGGVWNPIGELSSKFEVASLPSIQSIARLKKILGA